MAPFFVTIDTELPTKKLANPATSPAGPDIDSVTLPIDYFQTDTLSKHHFGKTHVRVSIPASDEDPLLKQSKLTHKAFMNLTLGYFLGQGTSAQGCVSRLVWDEDAKCRTLSACAQLQICKEARPSPKAAVQLGARVGVPVHFGPSTYQACLRRVLEWIDRSITVDTISHAIEVDEEGKIRWMAHTANWPAGGTGSFADMKKQTSSGYRNVQNFAPRQGIQAIVREAAALVAGSKQWDTLPSDKLVQEQENDANNSLDTDKTQTSKEMDEQLKNAITTQIGVLKQGIEALQQAQSSTSAHVDMEQKIAVLQKGLKEDHQVLRHHDLDIGALTADCYTAGTGALDRLDDHKSRLIKVSAEVRELKQQYARHFRTRSV